MPDGSESLPRRTGRGEWCCTVRGRFPAIPARAVELILEYQNWASGAAQRVMADGLACHEQFMATVGAVISPKEHPGDRQRPEQAQSHTSTTARPKAA